MSPSHSKRRGDVLEDIVATLHEVPGVVVQKRVRLPVLASNRKRRREIDVLLSQQVAGYPVRIAIECKNEERVVGTPRIDAFIGKLKDVGIPVGHGVFVSSTGFNRNALERAQQAGVRTLELVGLTPDRLSVAVNEALHSFVYIVASVDRYTRFDDTPEPNQPDGNQWERLPADLGQGLSAINTFIWQLWLTGRLRASLGSHHIFIRLPSRFSFDSKEAPFTNGVVVATVEVTAQVARIPGTARLVTLRDAATSIVEKIRVEGVFPRTQGRLELESFPNEESLQDLHSALNARHVLMSRIRVPRLVVGTVFWPPSASAIKRVLELRSRGEEISFASVEGTDLGRAWDEWTLAEQSREESG